MSIERSSSKGSAAWLSTRLNARVPPENADQILYEFGCRQRYILLVTSLLSFSWAIAAMPVMCSAFLTDAPDESDCSFNCTADKYCDQNSGRRTVISQFNLLGERRHLVEWITSAFMFGNMVGASTLTRLSDKIGRRPILIFSLIMLGITGSLTALARSIVVLIVGRFVQGICSPGALLVAWVLGYENVPIALRGFATLIFGVMWVIGYCAIAPLAYFIRNWKWFMVACTAPSMLLAVVYLFAIPESLHFLMANGRKQEATKWIRNAEKYGNVMNKRNVEMLVEQLERANYDMQMHGTGEKINEDLRCTVMQHLLKHKIFIIYILILIFLWTSDTFVYFGLSLYTTRLAGNKYWNYALSGLVELPAYIFAAPILENFGRRQIVAYTHFLAGISLTAVIIIPDKYWWLSMSSWLVAKFAISCSFMCIYVYGSEILPTTMRNVCLGLCAVIARFGGIVAPYIVTMGSISALLPIIFFGSVSIAAGALTLILPETRNRVLPASLGDAENAYQPQSGQSTITKGLPLLSSRQFVQGKQGKEQKMLTRQHMIVITCQ